jgi:hypothetical protein
MPIAVASRDGTSYSNLGVCAGGAKEPKREPNPLPESRQRCPQLETILVVDDEEEIRSLLRRFLERHGFAVQEAKDATEALKKADTLKESPGALVYASDERIPEDACYLGGS